MLIAEGLGILALLIPLACGLLAEAVFYALYGAQWASMYKDVQMMIAMFSGALGVWLLGRRLARKSGRTLLDPQTGERVVLRQRHTLFWIPMQYWSLVWLGLGVYFVWRVFN